MGGPIIKANASFDTLAVRLATHARALALAHAATRLLAKRRDDSRWHRAGLVWPLFAKG